MFLRNEKVMQNVPDDCVAALVLVNGAHLSEGGPVTVVEGLGDEEVVGGLLEHGVVVVVVEDGDHHAGVGHAAAGGDQAGVEGVVAALEGGAVAGGDSQAVAGGGFPGKKLNPFVCKHLLYSCYVSALIHHPKKPAQKN